MFTTNVALGRYAWSVLTGRRLAAHVPGRLLAGGLESYREFGPFEPSAICDLLDQGPAADRKALEQMLRSRLRRQVKLARGADESKDGTGESRRMRWGLFAERTPGAEVGLITRSGRTVCVGAAEWRSWITLAALKLLLSDTIRPDERVLHAGPSRGVASARGLPACAARVLSQQVVAVDPSDGVAIRRALEAGRPDVVIASPTGLKALAASPAAGDSHIRVVLTTGGLCADTVRARVAHAFGGCAFAEWYATSEALPMIGQRCSRGHFHFDPAMGLAELRYPDTGLEVEPGEVGELFLTPFAPFRRERPVVRLATGDLARRLPLLSGCELAAWPATGRPEGRLADAVRQHDRLITPLEIAEGRQYGGHLGRIPRIAV